MIIEHIFDKICDILSSVWGWLSLLVISAVTGLLHKHGLAITFTLLAVVQDLGWGIASSVKQGKFALSELARDTVSKLFVYAGCILTFVMIDKMCGVDNGLTTNIVCSVIILVELWSTLALMIICFPKIPLLRILKHALTGEIARKLNVDECSVIDALSETGINNKDINTPGHSREG